MSRNCAPSFVPALRSAGHSARPESLARLREIAAQCQVQARELGRVTRGDFRIEYNGAAVIHAAVESLRDAWVGALERALHSQAT